MDCIFKSQLIEASAGTGKTYNIQSLFFQFVACSGVSVEHILVVTYTKAATAELNDRIRRILKEGYEYLLLEKCEESSRIEPLLIGVDRKIAQARLLRALTFFDQASISTIHGFCQTVIQEYAFECNMLMNHTLVEDSGELEESLCQDFYRQHIYGRPDWEERVAYWEITYEEILKNTHNLLKKKHFQIQSVLGFPISLRDDAFIDIDAYLESKHFKVAFMIYAAQWVYQKLQLFKEENRILLFDDLLEIVRNQLVRGDSTVLKDALQKRFKVMIVDEFQDTDSIQYEIFKALQDKNHPLILVGDRKQAIYGFRGGDLATYMRAKHDMAQLEKKGEGVTLSLDKNFRSDPYLISAIESLFAQHQYPFACYKHVGNSSDFAIDFPRVSAGRPAEIVPIDPNPLKHIFLKLDQSITAKQLFQKTIQACALKINELLVDKEILIPSITDSGKEVMRSPQPNDFAILLISNKEADLALNVLKKLNIPAVVAKSGNVFDTPEASSLKTCLKAILEPNSAHRILQAMLTPFLGYSIDDLANIKKGGDQCVTELQSLFLQLRDHWATHSFIEMIEQFFLACKVRTRLAQYVDGARRLTNMNQLINILHQQATQQKLSPHHLVDFLLKELDKETRTENAEYEILLETDEQAVKIVTIHSSKGLEYPFVMLPGLFTGVINGVYIKTFDYYDGAQRVHFMRNGATDLESQDAKERAFILALQEKMRLTYVALTRAKYKCYIYWGNCKETDHVLTWLYGASDIETLFAPAKNKSNLRFPLCYLKQKADDILKNGPHQVWEIYSPNEKIMPYKNSSDNESLHFKPWQGDANVEAHFKITSFSHLTPHAHAKDSTWRADRVDDEYEDGDLIDSHSDEKNIFDVESSNVTGIAWHHLFEEIDFTESLTLDKVTSILKESKGFALSEENQYAFLTFQMAKNTLEKDLDSQGLSLSKIPTHHRMVELEFYFPLTLGFSYDQLKNMLADYALEYGVDSRMWGSRDLLVNEGYFKGYIDLVFFHEGKFYILDWKSNALDKKIENFMPSVLKKEMGKNFYFVQYLIYSIALMKYLHARTQLDWETLYERYFGGVYYLFLRGITADPQDKKGVYFVRPPLGILLKLKEILS